MMAAGVSLPVEQVLFSISTLQAVSGTGLQHACPLEPIGPAGGALRGAALLQERASGGRRLSGGNISKV